MWWYLVMAILDDLFVVGNAGVNVTLKLIVNWIPTTWVFLCIVSPLRKVNVHQFLFLVLGLLFNLVHFVP